MKKFLLFLVIVITILLAVYYKEIIATKDFYVFQNENQSAFSQATINWETLSFTSADYSAGANLPLPIGELKIPTPFVTTEREVSETYIRVVGGIKAFSVSSPVPPVDFLTANNFTAAEKKAACKFLSGSAELGACTSNYNLYRAFFELNETDIHMFSNITDKQLYNKIMLIRATALSSKTVSAFETKSVQGFLFTIDPTNFTAELFDKTDRRYTLTFTNMKEAEVAFVLSNIFSSGN